MASSRSVRRIRDAPSPSVNLYLMRIGKLFHLTPLVDSLPDAEFFFNSLFSPLCMMRNYSSHWHRHVIC